MAPAEVKVAALTESIKSNPVIPIVDISQPEAVAAAALHEACTTTGFFMCSGHGVPQELMDALFEQIHAVFALPENFKLAMIADENNRGCA